MINSQELKFSLKTEEKLAKRIDTIIEVLDDLNVDEKYFVLSNLYYAFLDICQKEGVILDSEGNYEGK